MLRASAICPVILYVQRIDAGMRLVVFAAYPGIFFRFTVGVRNRSAAIQSLIHTQIRHKLRAIFRPAIHKIGMGGINTSPALFPGFAMHYRVHRQFHFGRIQRGDLREYPGDVHINRRDFNRIVCGTFPVVGIDSIIVAMCRFQVDVIPTVGESDPDIKLDGIARFTQAAYFAYLVGVTFAVGT
ncbi:Uncharacterised protein [Salmonella enterica subsp. enterica serovar Typhi]|nr:Uncharacterised protein [Salmonella enterica subsp. enterica serovar Typhi]